MLTTWAISSLRAETSNIVSRRALHTTQVRLKKRRNAQQDAEQEQDDDFEDAEDGQDLFAVSDESTSTNQSTRAATLLAEKRAEARRTQIKRITEFTTLTTARKRESALLVTDKVIRAIVKDTTGQEDVQELKSVLKRWRYIGGMISPDTGSQIVARLKELHADVLAQEILANPKQYGVFEGAKLSATPARSSSAGPSATLGANRSFSTSTRRSLPNATATLSPKPSTKACPQCSASLPLSVSPCTSCSALVPIPSTVSFYELFDLSREEVGFDVDVRDLRSRFLRRQQKVHPDSFTGSDERTHALADSQSSFLNKAYSTLSDPLSRAQYLLELHGDPIAETDSLTDPELLMDILDAREQLEEAGTEEEMSVVRQANADRTKSTLANLSSAFSTNSPDIPRAKILAIELQYLRNLENAAKEWAPGKRVEIQH